MKKQTKNNNWILNLTKHLTWTLIIISLLSTMTSAYYNSSNFVSIWSFEQNLNDTLNRTNLTRVNGINFTTNDYTGYSIGNFTDTNYVTGAATNNSLQLNGNAISICWTTIGNITGDAQTIIGWYSTTGNNRSFSINVLTNPQNSIEFALGNESGANAYSFKSNANVTNTSGTLDKRFWCWTYDKTQNNAKAIFYINGANQSLNTGNANFSSATFYTGVTGVPLTIGRSNYTTGRNLRTTYVGEVYLANKMLNSSEVNQIYTDLQNGIRPGEGVPTAPANSILYVNNTHPNCNDSRNRDYAVNPNTPWCNIPETCQNDGDTIFVSNGKYINTGAIDITCSYNTTVLYKAQSNNTILSAELNLTGVNRWMNASGSGSNRWTANITGNKACYYNDTPLFPVNTYERLTNTTFYGNDMERSYSTSTNVTIRLNSGLNPTNLSLTCFNDNVMDITNSRNIIVDGFTFTNGLILFRSSTNTNVSIVNSTFYGGLSDYGAITLITSTNNIIKNIKMFTRQSDTFYWAAIKNQHSTWEDSTIGVEQSAVQLNAKQDNLLIQNVTSRGYFNGIQFYNTGVATRASNVTVKDNNVTNCLDDAYELEYYMNYTNLSNNYGQSFTGISMGPSNCTTSQSCIAYGNVIVTDINARYNKTYNQTPYTLKLKKIAPHYTTGWNFSKNTFVSTDVTFADYYYLGAGNSTNMRWKDNIFRSQNDYVLYATGLASLGVFFDYNVYYRAGTSGNYFKYWNTAPSTLTNLSVAKASAYWDGTWDVHSLQVDPGFVNEAGGDYRILSTSSLCTAASDGGVIGAKPCVTDTLTNLIVTINSSLNGSVWGTYAPPRTVQYYFTEDRNRTANCSLLVNNIKEINDTSKNANTWYNITSVQTLTNGLYNLTVNCTSTAGVTDQSDLITIEIQSPLINITNLQLFSNDLSSAYVTWENPEDENWRYNAVYLNDTFIENTVEANHNFTGLTANQVYNATIIPIDYLGNSGTPSTIQITTRVYPIVTLNYALNSSNMDRAACGGTNGANFDDSTKAFDDNFTSFGFQNGVGSYQCLFVYNISRPNAGAVFNNLTLTVKTDGATRYYNISIASLNNTNQVQLNISAAGITSANPPTNISFLNSSQQWQRIGQQGGGGTTSLYETQLNYSVVTTQELIIDEITTLNGSQITSATVCNQATNNCSSGTLPLYLAVFNGSQTLTVATDGNWNYTYTYNSLTNETTSITGIYNTIINWNNPITNLTTNIPTCSYDNNQNQLIPSNNNNYETIDGTYTIYCKNNFEITNYTITKIPNTPLNTTLYTIPPIVNISDTCTNANTAMHFQLYDEQTLLPINGNIYNYLFTFNVSNQLYTLNGTYNGQNNFSLCINATSFPTWTLTEGQIFYTSNGYTNRRYYIFAGTRITSETYNIALYNLNSSVQTTFGLTIASNSLGYYSGKYITLLRWYPNYNTYNVVDMGLTDDIGNTVTHVQAEDTDYRIGVYELDGTLIYLAQPIRLYCLSTPCTYTLKVNNTDTNYIAIENTQADITYDSNTGIFSLIYNDPTQQDSNVSLIVYSDSGTESTIACSNTLFGYTGATSCNASLYPGRLRAIVYSDNYRYAPLTSKIIDTTTSVFTSKLGLFLSFLLATLIIFILAIINPIMGIIGAVIALLPAFFLGTINYGIIIGIAILAGITIHMMKKSGVR